MELMFPKNKYLEEYLHDVFFYRKVGDKPNQPAYRGVFEFAVARQNLHLNSRDFAKFFKLLKVKGGQKKKEGDTLIIEPFRTKRINVRMTEDLLKLLRKVANKLDRDPSEHARIHVLDALRRVLEGIGWPENEIKQVVERWPREEKWGDIGKTSLSIRVSGEQSQLLNKVARSGGQKISEYVRMVLSSGLPNEAATLKLFEETQTSEGATRGG